MYNMGVFMNKVTTILGALILVVSITGGADFLEDRYAKAGDLKNQDTRLTVHIAQDRINFLQQQIWAMEDRCGNDPVRMTPDQRQRYREMLSDCFLLLLRQRELRHINHVVHHAYGYFHDLCEFVVVDV